MIISESVRIRLRQAKKVCIFTGAGASAESGIQTFRSGADGLWAGVDPMTVATPEAFRTDPQRVWDFYVHRAEAIRNASPNAAHRAIAKMSEMLPTAVVTQNIDGLHEQAGSKGVIELHGNIFRLKPFAYASSFSAEDVICPACDGYASHEEIDPYVSREDFQAIQLIAGDVPRCPACNTLLRPDVTWFHEALDAEVVCAALTAVSECDAMIVVGSSLEVAPARDMPFLALQRGATVIEVNPQETELTGVAHATFALPAAEVLPALLHEVWGITMEGAI